VAAFGGSPTGVQAVWAVGSSPSAVRRLRKIWKERRNLRIFKKKQLHFQSAAAHQRGNGITVLFVLFV
jgi:hypothetical protein